MEKETKPWCNNFINDFTKKLTKYNSCNYCSKRFDLCKNLDNFYNHINFNHVSILLRQYSADENDIDVLLTALHSHEKLRYFDSEYLVRFLYDFHDEEYIINSIKQHLKCINDDYMPYIAVDDDEYRIYTEKNTDNIKFTEWLKIKILK